MDAREDALRCWHSWRCRAGLLWAGPPAADLDVVARLEAAVEAIRTPRRAKDMPWDKLKATIEVAVGNGAAVRACCMKVVHGLISELLHFERWAAKRTWLTSFADVDDVLDMKSEVSTSKAGRPARRKKLVDQRPACA